MRKIQDENKTRRRSLQRETIWNFLKDRKDHPTADVIYAHVRESLPHISLGTVYRNLTLLEEMGYVATIDVGDGVAHFDPNSKPHSHFSCTVCGSVMDVPAVEIDPLWENTSVVPGKVQGISILFSGCCNHCLSGNRV